MKALALPGLNLTGLTRDELAAEVMRLNAVVKAAGLDARHTNIRHEGELAASRAETETANRNIRQAESDARIAANDHRREMQGATADLVASQDLVAALKASQTALASSEARQRAVFDSAMDFAMVVTNPAGLITDWNFGAERVMGWTAAEMRGRSAEDFFTPEDRASGRVGDEMQQALNEGRVSDERWHLRKGEQRFWASGEMMPLYDDDGTHLGFVKILRDRTSEHVTGKALAEAERRLQRAQEAGGIGLFSVELADDLLRPTPEFCRLFGLPAAESYPAEAFERLIVPEDRHLVSKASGRAQGDVIRDVQYRIRRADSGELRWVARKGEIERDEAGRPVRFSGAARDITTQREAVDALAASEERFRTILDTIEAAFAIVEVKFDADERPVDYRFVEANPAFERQAGVNLRGKWVTEFAPNLERFWFDTYGRVASTGEPATFENYAEAFAR